MHVRDGFFESEIFFRQHEKIFFGRGNFFDKSGGKNSKKYFFDCVENFSDLLKNCENWKQVEKILDVFLDFLIKFIEKIKNSDRLIGPVLDPKSFSKNTEFVKLTPVRILKKGAEIPEKDRWQPKATGKKVKKGIAKRVEIEQAIANFFKKIIRDVPEKFKKEAEKYLFEKLKKFDFFGDEKKGVEKFYGKKMPSNRKFYEESQKNKI